MSEKERFIKLVQEFKELYEKSEHNKGKVKFVEGFDLFIFGWESIVKHDRYGESYYKCEMKNVK